MKSFFKWAGLLLALVILVCAGLGIHFWYFRPYTINVFFERVFIQYALKEPELLSSIGLLEQFGIDAHNDDLTDASPAQTEMIARRTRDDLDMLRAYDRAGLTDSQQLSYDVLEWFLRDRVDGERWQYHDYPVNQMLGVQSDTPRLMTQIHRINDVAGARDYVERLAKFGWKFDGVLESIRLRESKGVLPPKFVIARVLEQMRSFTATPAGESALYTNLSDKLGKLEVSEGERERLLADTRREIEQTVYPAYQRLIAFFEEALPKVTEDYGVWRLPDGDAYYDYLVRSHTTTSLDAETVHQLGLTEVARIEAEMDAILKEQGLPEGTIAARIARLDADPRLRYSNDDTGRRQCLADYQRFIDEITAGLDPYFGVRPGSTVKVERIPEMEEATSAQAYYMGPSLDGARPGIFYANLRDMSEIQKFSMRTTAYHEAVPGHHFQTAIAQELEGVPTFRKLVPFTAYDEGWGLYAERLAWELGFEKDPLDNLGRLQAEMFRAVRLVVDTGIHRERWTREQAIEYMIEKTGIPEGEVVSEIERYFVLPGQALAYKVGMLKLLELRERARSELGDRFDMKGFHDVVLTNGSLPLGVLEKLVDRWIASQSQRAGSESKAP